MSFSKNEDDIDVQIDEGFGDIEEPVSDLPLLNSNSELETIAPPSVEESSDIDEVCGIIVSLKLLKCYTYYSYTQCTLINSGRE